MGDGFDALMVLIGTLCVLIGTWPSRPSPPRRAQRAVAMYASDGQNTEREHDAEWSRAKAIRSDSGHAASSSRRHQHDSSGPSGPATSATTTAS